MKRQGTVLCLAVYSTNKSNYNSTFKSKSDETWKAYSKRKSNYGWILYGDGRRGVNIRTSSFGRSINIASVVKELLFL